MMNNCVKNPEIKIGYEISNKEELATIVGLIVSGLFIEDYDCHEVEFMGLNAVIKIKDIPYAVIRVEKGIDV